MRVLADLHHDDLYNSLRILFEERLGWQLYRPIGMGWHTEGFWKVYDHPATAQQYLGLHQGEEFAKRQQEQPNGGHRWLNEGLAHNGNGVYHIPNVIYPDKPMKAITLEAFKASQFDVIVSSMEAHFPVFERLRTTYMPGAKHIFQMGNMWAVPHGVQNLLNSTTVNDGHVPNRVRYHQEFDRNLYHPGRDPGPKRVSSFLHYNKSHGRGRFLGIEGQMPDWEWCEYGAGNRDGPIAPGGMPQAIRDSALVFHVKICGDGYGYNIHHAAASGRPVIFSGQHVKGQTAESLLTHGVTGIDVDQCPFNDTAAGLVRRSYDEQWGNNMYTRFQQVCDFDKEFEEIKQFLERLI
jgi:hypothetical protein